VDRSRERIREKEKEERERERLERIETDKRRERFINAERERERQREQQKRDLEARRQRSTGSGQENSSRERSPISSEERKRRFENGRGEEGEEPNRSRQSSPFNTAEDSKRDEEQEVLEVAASDQDNDSSMEEYNVDNIEVEETERSVEQASDQESSAEEIEDSADESVKSELVKTDEDSVSESPGSQKESDMEEVEEEEENEEELPDTESEGEENDEKKHSSPENDNDVDGKAQVSDKRTLEPASGDIDATYMEESPPVSPVELKPELPPYLPAIQGCRNVLEFDCLNRIEEGTYGVVYRARHKKTSEIVALKRLKMEKEKEGFPITSLREINTLLKAQHPNIVTVREIVVGSNMDKIYIVMDYVEHDLKSLMETMKQPFLIGEVKTLMIQLLRAVAHLHDNWILHRDLKTSNLLLSHKGILKVGDFGLAREYGSPLKHYTPVVVTLWYRAPELLLGSKEYSTPIDLWSVGCIFGELLTMKALFPGKSEASQLDAIFKDLGTPNEKIWPGYSELPMVKKVTFAEKPYNNLRKRFEHNLTNCGLDLMNKLLTYDPKRRVTAEDALKHEYFTESPLPVDPSMFPTWPAKSELGAHTRTTQSPKPPSGGKQYAKQLGEDDDVAISGFHMGGKDPAVVRGDIFRLRF